VPPDGRRNRRRRHERRSNLRARIGSVPRVPLDSCSTNGPRQASADKDRHDHRLKAHRHVADSRRDPRRRCSRATRQFVRVEPYVMSTVASRLRSDRYLTVWIFSAMRSVSHRLVRSGRRGVRRFLQCRPTNVPIALG